MKLQLSKFGTTLVSRQAGREALAAIQPVLAQMKNSELLEISFEGIVTFSPSWGDEVITSLKQTYGDRLVLQPTNNLSVVETLELLESIHQFKITFSKAIPSSQQSESW